MTRIPRDMSEIRYDGEAGRLTVGDGQIEGVRPQVWAYSVSGMPVLSKWLGYRTAKGTGRAASSASGLDKVRPSEWHDDWNDELLDLIRVLTITIDKQDTLADLLDRILSGPLIPASALPVPADAEREPPATIARFWDEWGLIPAILALPGLPLSLARIMVCTDKGAAHVQTARSIS